MGKNKLDIEAYQQLVEYIYDAALEPVLWQRFLETMAKTLNGHAGIFRVLDAKTYSLDYSAVFGHDADYVQQYQEDYTEGDILRPILDRLPVGTIINRTDFLSDTQWVQSELYSEFLKDRDVYHILGGHLVQSGPCVARIGVHRSKQEGMFNKDDLQFMSRLVPHIQKAFRISQKIQGVKNAYQSATDALDHMPIGIIFINATGKPIYINRQAALITCSGSSLMLKIYGLHAVSPHENIVLQQLIQQATQGGKENNIKSGGAITLSQTSQSKPISLVITPLGDNKTALGINVPQATAAIFIGDAEQQHDISIALLCDLYKLTTAEAKLVNELAKGHSPNEIAERFGISKHTARDQLKAAFQKTGTKRQTELVKLVLQGPAVIRGFGE